MDDTSLTVTGDGAAVVLVHGMGLNMAMWQGQAAALSNVFKVVRYDLLGHGASAARPVAYGPGPYEIADFVDQLARVLDHLGIERCRLVGFSLGGLIAQAFTIAHGHRVERLAILNTGFDRDDGERAGMIERLKIARKDGFTATIEMALERWFTPAFATAEPEAVDQVRQWMAANDGAVYPEIYRLLAHGDRELAGLVATISCPTLVLTCDGDSGSPPAMARRMADAIPYAYPAIVPSLRHMGLFEEPSAINKILLPFLTA